MESFNNDGTYTGYTTHQDIWSYNGEGTSHKKLVNVPSVQQSTSSPLNISLIR